MLRRVCLLVLLFVVMMLSPPPLNISIRQSFSREIAMPLISREFVEPLVDSPGKSVGSDFNGDGIHDVVMGADQNADIGTSSGAAYLLYGTGGLSTSYLLNGGGVNVTILGIAANSRFGFDVGSAGDVNSDGFDDIIMGAVLNDTGATNAGSAYILYGSPNLSATYRLDELGVDVSVVGKAASDFFGYTVSGAGDVNGDGFDDVIFGSRYNDDAALDAGAAYILYGSASLSATYQLNGGGVNVTILGKAANDSMSNARGAGDVNADGLDDVITGALLNDDGGLNAGAAYLLLGSASLSATIQLNGVGVNFTILGDAAEDNLGFSATSAGDVNGDGFSDLIAGARGISTAYLFYGGSGLSGTKDTGASEENVKMTGKTGTDRFGIGTSGAGDINDDGFFDIIVGADQSDENASNSGAAYIIYGSSSLPSAIPAGNSDVTVLGRASGDFLGGRAVSGVGDITNDGFPDLIVGAYANDDAGLGTATDNDGAVYLIFGSASLPSLINMAGGGPEVTILAKGAGNVLGFEVGGGRASAGP